MPSDEGGTETRHQMVCSTGAEEILDYVGQFQRVARDALVSASRTPTGASFRFRASEGVEAALWEFVGWENRCCPFLRFRVEQRRDELEMGVEGPEDAALVLDLLVAHSRGDRHHQT